MQQFHPLFAEDVYSAIALETCVKERKSAGGPAPEQVQKQIAWAKDVLASYQQAAGV